MAIIGLDTNRKNPSYTIDDFTFWIPKMKPFRQTEEGIKYFNKIYPLANNKVFYSIFGSDWEYAISLVIAHYITLIGKQTTRPVGNTLADATSDNTVNGVLTGVSVGGFSKQYDYNSVMSSNNDDALFWNQTPYGVSFWAILQTKSNPAIFVVTDGDPYQNKIDDNNNHPYKPHTKF